MGRNTARRGSAAAAAATAVEEEAPAPGPAPRVTGQMRLTPIDAVSPNSWNPNRMSDLQMQSTREGMQRDGWIAAYALLVWGSDEQGRKRNIIIDGEHRWRIAGELGFKKGPMVFLEGITEKRAKEMTIELDNKRGKFDEPLLRTLLTELNAGGADDGLAFRLGFDEETFAALTTTKDVLAPGDFSEVTIDAKTDYCCPKCGYEWSGAASSKKKDEG